MEDLKRYGPSTNKMGFGTMQQLDNGGWVKFSEVKELLQTSHNNAITKFCPHHSSNKQCIWGLRGCCNVAPCKVRPELRK